MPYDDDVSDFEEQHQKETGKEDEWNETEKEQEEQVEKEKGAEKDKEQEEEAEEEPEKEAEKQAVDGEVKGGPQEKGMKLRSPRPDREKKESKYKKTPYRDGAGAGDDKPAGNKRKNEGKGTTKNKKSKK